MAGRCKRCGSPGSPSGATDGVPCRLSASRAAAGRAGCAARRFVLAAQGVSFGVALGHLLPEEQLATAARWTGRALRIAGHLGDRELLASVLRMHGNEPPKPGHVTAGIIRLRQSPQIDDHPGRRGAGLVLLARAAAESGQAELFNTVTEAMRPGSESHRRARSPVQQVHRPGGPPPRGCLPPAGLARPSTLRKTTQQGDRPPTPQWRVIERITTADVLARAGDEHTAADMLSAALSDAGTLRLPHQVQRIIRLTGQPGVLTGQPVRAQAEAVLTRLDRQLAEGDVRDRDTTLCGRTWG